MSTAPLSLEFEDGVAVIRLDDAATLNGISHSNLDALPQMVGEAGDRGATYLVLQGTSANFCSGGAASFLAEMSQLPLQERADLLTRGQAWVNGLLASPCLTVAAVEGLAAGAGVDFLLAFDAILLGPHARMSFFYNRLGAIPDLGGLWLLAERIGPAAALEFYASGAVWSADDAQARGVGNVIPSPFPENAAAWSAVLRRRLPITRTGFAAAKLALNRARLSALASHQSDVAAAQAAIFGSEDFQQRLRRVSTIQRIAAGR